MKRVRKNERHRWHRASGFSLLEMMMVMSIMIVMASIGFMSLQPSLRAQRVTNAYNTTLSALRQARDNAVSQRTSYHLQFTKTSTLSSITVSPTLATFQGVQTTLTYELPRDVAFSAESGIPTSGTPDNFGSATSAIDFGYTPSGTGTGGSADLYFCPDGSVQDAANGAGNCGGNWNSGVVYIARPGELLSSRAITVWGGTGRIRGWRLYGNSSGGVNWVRQ
jgi:prepilin-type N-terminal cleavage/methylation domain-containing protein